MTSSIRLATARIDADLDPEAWFLWLQATEEHVFWLDGGPDAASGWSVVGTGEVVSDDRDVRRAVVRPVPRSGEEPPFQGGWVGWWGYEQGAAHVGAPVAVADAPPSAWMQVVRAVAFDHERGAVWAMAPDAVVDDWRSEVERWAKTQDAPLFDAVVEEVGEAQSRHGTAEYASLVDECRSAIRAGDAYLLCLTTRFTVKTPGDPVAVYRRLRRATPAHHGGFVRVGEYALLSASPEQFLRVSAEASGGGARVVTRPIKGTRPRGADENADRQLAAELVSSQKERAENVMIVDLMRNDLARICDVGSVRVDALWSVETYPAVHQLVSTVSGRVRAGVDVGEIVSAVFPAGSMTGAPKLSAMTVLHGLERAPRGVYSGCFGYVGFDGTIDLAMVIRSIVIGPEGAAVGAGGGITWLSDSAAETAEVALKARAPLAALGARLPAEWADVSGDAGESIRL